VEKPNQEAGVLVVDDRVEIRELVKEVLGQAGVSVVDTAGSGEEALTKIANNDYIMVLLDLKLTDMDGLELLPVIKEKKPGTRVIVMSGQEDELINRGLQLGANGYLTKPFNVNQILHVLEASRENAV